MNTKHRRPASVRGAIFLCGFVPFKTTTALPVRAGRSEVSMRGVPRFDHNAYLLSVIFARSTFVTPSAFV